MSDMYEVKEQDTHTIWFVVRDEETNAPIDLTDVTEASAYAKRKGEDAVLLAIEPVLPLTNGVYKHQLTGDLLAGTYSVVVKMKKNGEQITTPTEDFDCLVVTPTIGAAL